MHLPSTSSTPALSTHESSLAIPVGGVRASRSVRTSDVASHLRPVLEIVSLPGLDRVGLGSIAGLGAVGLRWGGKGSRRKADDGKS